MIVISNTHIKLSILVSIIIPAYNASNYIKDAINSVLLQSYKNIEIIIIDDNSTDDTVNIVKSYDSKFIKLICNSQNYGPGVCRILGLRKASGDYLAFLDADDIWSEEKLENQLNFMIKNNNFISFTAFSRFKTSPCIIGRKISTPKKIDYFNLLKNTCICISTVMIDRKILIFDELIRLNSDKIYVEDYILLFYLLKKVKYAYSINYVYTFYRILPNSFSRNKFKYIKKVFLTYLFVEKIPIIILIYYYFLYLLRGIIKYSRF